MRAIQLIRLRYVLIVLGIGLVPAIAWKIIEYPISRQPVPARFTPPQSQAEANRQDLIYLRDSLHRVDRSFSPAAWGQFDSAIDELLEDAGGLGRAEFEMRVARALALANNGHTNVHGVGWGLTLNSLPLRFAWFAEGLFVVASGPAHQDLLGAKVLHEDGHTPEKLAEAFSAYVGGPPSLSRELAPHFMKSPAALHAAALTPSPSSATLELQLRDGRVVTRTVVADPNPANGPPTANVRGRDPRERWPQRDLSPMEVPNTVHPWTHILSGRAMLPQSLRHPDKFYWRTGLADGDALYVQINATADQPKGMPLRAFLQQTLDEVAASQPRKVIVDLRFNSGGNYALTADFTSELPKTVPAAGRIFILTGGNSFSAAIITAARLKYFSKSKASIVGEPMGDREQFWAEAATRIHLPNSHLVATYATGYHDWERGCSLSEVFICAPENLYLGVAAGKLAPDHKITWSFPDYLNGEDTALNAVLHDTSEPAAPSYLTEDPS